MPLHWPGYNYLGPGTKDFSKKPKNKLDAAAREHDVAYGHLGSKAYFTYNTADRAFLSAIDRLPPSERDSVPAVTAKKFFQWKKYAFSGRTVDSQSKMPRTYKRKRTTRQKMAGPAGRARKRRVRRTMRKPKRFSRSYMRRSRAVVPRKNINTFKNVTSGSLQSSSGTASWNYLSVGTNTDLEAMAADVKYLDVTDAGATVVKTMNLTTGSLQSTQELRMLSMRRKIDFRNNSTAPMEFQLMWLDCIKDSEDDPTTVLKNNWNSVYGLALASANSVNVQYTPYDDRTFFKYYKITKVKKGILNSGSQMSVFLNAKPGIRYNPKVEDYELTTQEYRRGKTRFLLFRIQGCVSHEDATPTTVGYSPAQVDWVVDKVYKYGLASKQSQNFIQAGGTTLSLTTSAFADPQEGKIESYEV